MCAASLEGLCISAHSATKGKLFASRRVLDVKRTLGSLKRLGTGSNGTLGQLSFGHACETLEIIVARVAKVGGSKAEVDGY